MPLLTDRLRLFGGRPAVTHAGVVSTFEDLEHASARVATALLDGADDLGEARVAFLVRPGPEYVATLLGIWRVGGIAAPLCVSHPLPELEYVMEDSGAAVVVADGAGEQAGAAIAASTGARLLMTSDAMSAAPKALPSGSADTRAMMLYTSGTTSRPKGVVTTHGNICAQITSLVEAWGWTGDDHILHVLPLHHIHGIINVLCCSLWSGATCEMHDGFDADAVWARIREGGLTLFMAVPTIYARLIAAWESAPAADRESMSDAARGLRLMVSGSAALPVPTLERWERITGHRLLERYGMTEIGMGLSNPLDGERRPGSVGEPLPGVDVRLVGDDGAVVADGSPGEIQVRGPGVFGEYWGKAEATSSSFTEGWFRTGDVALLESGRYRILGRQSVDIIKTGGYKVSALEIESVLRGHEHIAECAIVGIADDEWGERVAAAIVLKAGATITLEALRDWGKERLAVYKVPSRLSVQDTLPSNAMGKVVKPEVRKLFPTDD
jgi:malonyl-CoA/methylmalonyl-CoA synthetase